MTAKKQPLFDSAGTRMYNAMDLPAEDQQEVMDVLRNAKAVKGMPFVSHVLFINNLKGLLNVMIRSTTIKQEVGADRLRDIVSTICDQLQQNHAHVAGVKPEDMDEAMKLSETLESLAQHIGRD